MDLQLPPQICMPLIRPKCEINTATFREYVFEESVFAGCTCVTSKNYIHAWQLLPIHNKPLRVAFYRKNVKMLR